MAQPRVAFTLTISDRELCSAFLQWCADNEVTSHPEGVRILLRQALASTPLDGAQKASAKRAFMETKRYALGKTAEFFYEFAQHLKELEAAQAEENNGAPQ